jgi:hypothetical protein
MYRKCYSPLLARSIFARRWVLRVYYPGRLRDISYFRASQPHVDHRGDGAAIGATS